MEFGYAYSNASFKRLLDVEYLLFVLLVIKKEMYV